MATPWILKNSNDQTSGLKAALSFPGMLWWFLPCLFFGTIGADYWASAFDWLPFHPLWLRVTVMIVFFIALTAWGYGVYLSEKKRKLHSDGSYK